MENKLQRKFGLFTAICMVVGIVIGSGVFFKAQNILERTGGNLPMGIIAWLIGGAIMLCCLLTFAFMGQKYEKARQYGRLDSCRTYRHRGCGSRWSGGRTFHRRSRRSPDGRGAYGYAG